MEELHIARCGRDGKRAAAASGLAGTAGHLVAADAHLEAEASVRKLEEELRLLEKDRSVSTSLLASVLADQAEERDSKWENLGCRFATLGGRKLLRIRV